MEDFWFVANTYLCMEQYMMAGKGGTVQRQEIREQILKCSDPKRIKALGHKVERFDQKGMGQVQIRHCDEWQLVQIQLDLQHCGNFSLSRR